MSEANKELVRRHFEEIWNRRDLAVADELMAQFPDLHMEVEAIVAEGDTVAVRVLSEGTNLGPLNGVVPPTGKRFAARQSHWFRVENGRLAEHWATREDLVAMMQLGVVQPPGRPPSWPSAHRTP
jgi:predicted ester cyclase